MATNSNKFPNRNYYWRLESSINWQSGTSVSLHLELHIDGDGTTYSNSGTSSWELYVQGSKVNSWLGSFDFRNGTTRAILYQDVMTSVQNDGKIDVDAYANYDIMGYVESHVDVYGAAPTVPPAPTQNQPTNITTTSMRVTFSGNGDGGRPIIGWELHWATDAAFTQNVQSVVSSGTTDVTGLTPGTTYYFRSRGRNEIGLGPFSNVVSQTTLPATPPGITVTPAPSGQSAAIALTPPSGVSGVTEYNVERRVMGTTTPVTTLATPTTSLNATGLAPGTSYEWRANAEIGSYTSPWSNWVAAFQPNPNTNPGTFFDGATADTVDIDYAFTGAANNSTSTATGVAPLGWQVATDSGAAIIQRVTGGRSGTFAARVTVQSDATNVRAGMRGSTPYFAEVEAAATYVGSVYVWAPVARSLAAEISWYTAAGALISRTLGALTAVPAGSTNWTRLIVSGVAPALTDHAAVRAFATGAVPGGTVWTMDDAMITLSSLFDWFSGSSPDSALYDYVWLGDPNASQSQRNELPVSNLNPLADPDCAPLPAPPSPPTITSECIDEVGIWRRYIVQIPASEVRQWSSTLPTLILTTDGTAERQVRIRVFPNPDGVAPELIDATQWDSEQILTYIPPDTEITLDGVTQRVWASVAGAPLIAADELLYGTGGIPATWPELRCGIGYVFTLDVPLDAPSGNLETRVLLTQRM